MIWLMAMLMVSGLVLPVMQTAKAEGEEAYAVFDGTERLIFYYDTLKDRREGTVYSLNDEQPWSRVCRQITAVIFDPSFADYRPASTSKWFYACIQLTTILDIEYLNTSNVQSMEGMFAYCRSLSQLDLSNFDTSNVNARFGMREMFHDCSSLTELDLSTFVMDNVRNVNMMFCGCSELETIYVSPADWYSDHIYDIGGTFQNGMFSDCTKLTGGAGTEYSDENTNAYYAHIDGGESNPGYFTVAPSNADKSMRASASGKHFDTAVTKDESTGIVKSTLPADYTGWTDTNYPVLLSADYQDYVFWGYTNNGTDILDDRDDITNETYALFFPPDVFNLYVQFRAESLTGDPEKTDLRLISSAPDAADTFSKFGFKLKKYGHYLNASHQAWGKEGENGQGFLQTVIGNSNGTIVTLTKDAFNPTLTGTLALQTAKGMPNALFTSNINGSTLTGTVLLVRPFLITLDGTTSYGAPHVFRVFFDENNAPKAQRWIFD